MIVRSLLPLVALATAGVATGQTRPAKEAANAFRLDGLAPAQASIPSSGTESAPAVAPETATTTPAEATDTVVAESPAPPAPVVSTPAIPDSAAVTTPPSEASAASTPASPPAAASRPELRAGFTLDTPIAELIANPGARAVLDKDLPGLSTDANLDKFAALGLRQFQPLTGGQLTNAMLLTVARDLSRLDGPMLAPLAPTAAGTSRRNRDTSR